MEKLIAGDKKQEPEPQGEIILKFDIQNLTWTREPESCVITQDRIEIVTKPHTDLWQRTYYHFRNDNAPVLQMETEETFFSFLVKTEFSESHHRFDQCGIVVYLDSENWLKGSVEYENEQFQHLGSGDQSRLFRLGDHRDPRPCKNHVVPLKPQRR